MNPCFVKSILRLICGCLSLGLLIGTTGCMKNSREPQSAEVSGKVLFKGKALPGGQVLFVATKGGFPSSAPIDENGNYRINAPIGDVQISVTNRMFQPQRKGKSGQGQDHRLNKRPDHQQEAKSIKGRYVPIPPRYADGATSGLTYTVTPGPQTHDIELSDKPAPTPGPAGP
jgi:hypothetical protein